MRVLIQRVSRASVTVDGRRVAETGCGFLALVGVAHGDDGEVAAKLAAKTARLRVFTDEEGLMNLALAEVGGEAGAVTAAPEVGEMVYEAYVEALRAEGVPVQTGVFGAHMQVELLNDGPVTILLEA